MENNIFNHFSGYYECKCPANRNGVHCDIYDENFPGGIGKPVSPSKDTVPYICQQHNCPQKSNNGQCDVSSTFNYHLLIEMVEVLVFLFSFVEKV